MKRRKNTLDELLSDAAMFYTQPTKYDRRVTERPTPQPVPVKIASSTAAPIPKAEPVPVSFRPPVYNKRIPIRETVYVDSEPSDDTEESEPSDDMAESEENRYSHLKHPLILASGIKPTNAVPVNQSREFLSSLTLGISASR